MPTDGKLRAGVIGLGVMGRHHSRVLNSLEGVEFVGVHDRAKRTKSLAVEPKKA